MVEESCNCRSKPTSGNVSVFYFLSLAMRYKISIQQEDLNTHSSSDKYVTIYEQIVNDLSVRAVVNLINEADDPKTIVAGNIESVLQN